MPGRKPALWFTLISFPFSWILFLIPLTLTGMEAIAKQAAAQGLNYPGCPVIGIFMMIVFCLLLGTILAWLYFRTNSPWVAALGHGSVNAIAGLPILFFEPGFNMTIGGTLASPIAWIGMVTFIARLVLTKRFPTTETQEET